jgi:hypothetical protein
VPLGVRDVARLAALALVVACSEPAATRVPRVPTTLTVLQSPATTATVGTVAGDVSLKVTDAAGLPMRGVVVMFTISRGAGTLSAASAVTDTAGVASATYRAGSLVTTNEISALVKGFAARLFTVVTTAGVAKSIAFGQFSLRYTPAQDSLFATATVRDTFLNNNGAAVAWTARNPSLIGVTPSGGGAAVRALTRPGSTWLVASSGSASDSLLVVVQDSTTTPCTFIATPSPAAFPVGSSLAFDNGVVCVGPTGTGAEYAVVAHFNTGAYPVSQSFAVTGEGIVPPVGSFPVEPPPSAPAAPTAMFGDVGFERRMRAQEAREIGPRVASARAAITAARQPGMRSNFVAAPKVGDVVSLNVNAIDFCDLPDIRHGRIAAVSKTAIIVADVENPSGGFTDAEYDAFAAEMDTLVLPVDTAAFGSPSDVDGNGRVTIFFTRAVNELTQSGSPGGVVLGFYYLRDLLPRRSEFGDCPGSNVGELLYLLVPDAAGDVNGNVRSKTYVSTSIVGTIAHEFQHLINASRRMYVNDAVQVDEETWLSEGLSHVAEELVFFRASGLSPRANLGAAQVPPGSAARDAFDKYEVSNFGRYLQYLGGTEFNSPLADDDLLATRGATWAFLRYLVDRARPSDGDFWRRLVNSRWTGVANLDSALAGSGLTAMSGLRDWTTAVLMDDIAPLGTTPLQQSSWNFLSAFPGVYGQAVAYSSRVLLDGIARGVGEIGGGTSFLRFGVAQNREALIRASAIGGGPLPAGMRLTLVRLK